MAIVWFLVMSVCNNCTGGDLGIFPGFQQHYDKTYVAMPSQEACVEAQKLNNNSECWAKPKGQP